ncbi:trypsin-like peptidase domain-containing protein [Trinickia dinghuensis]|nr:trypsin-like peptidase domain-containing protein [Trinickia dinghuensis]
MVDRCGPAVVNISTATSAAPGDQADQPAVAPGLDSLDPDDPVFALVRATAGQPPSQPSVPDAPRVMWGSGSGFIISADGIVVTTAHVVNRAEQVTVTLTDKRQFKADVLAVDPQSDIALLQLEHASKLPVVRLGDSTRVRVGERVLSIGSPDGPQNAVTSGLVSVTPHALPNGGEFSFLETDIATEPDNSGGPLLDRNGNAIGVGVQVYADDGRYRSLTLAIPIEAVLRLRAQLQQQGKLASGSLGVQLQDVNPGLAVAFGLPHAMGALVTDVTPAAHGGVATALKPGDIVTHINGKPIAHEAELTDYVSALQPGSKVALTVMRNKRPMQLTTTVVASGGDRAGAATPTEHNALQHLGLTVHALSDSERSTIGVTYGVVVDVATGIAANAGIQAGDIILSVNSEAISTPEALDRSIARGGREIALLIQRDDARSFISLAVH